MNPADYQYFHGKPMAVEPNVILELLEKGFLPAIIIFFSFWFIKYQNDQCRKERENIIQQARKEREELMLKDTANDERLIHLVESTTRMIDEMKNAVHTNTQTMKELLTEMRVLERR